MKILYDLKVYINT